MPLRSDELLAHAELAVTQAPVRGNGDEPHSKDSGLGAEKGPSPQVGLRFFPEFAISGLEIRNPNPVLDFAAQHGKVLRVRYKDVGRVVDNHLLCLLVERFSLRQVIRGGGLVQ